MKQKQRHRPIRKCHGCGLNLGDHCGIYAAPKETWHNHPCPGYKNEAMLADYRLGQGKRSSDAAKEKRREVAKQRSSEPHWQGTLPYANR